jgi:group I intron endonuclease
MLIYKITNLIHGRVYIGQTIQTNPKMRWYSHQADARHGKKSHLYDSMRKHGVENFNWEIIDQAKSVEELNELESKWLAHYRSVGEVYNNREAVNNKLHSAESIERMKEAQRKAHARRRAENGGVETTNRVLKTSGWKNSEQAKLNKKMAQRKYWDSLTTPRKLTEEHKQKVSISGKLAWAKRKLNMGGGTQN